MENLWAPWRIEYILGKKESRCIFCPDAPELTDEERLILFHGEFVMVMMNRFPYNNGHLLVAPWRHVSGLDQLSGEEMRHLMNWVRISVSILGSAMKCDGYNVGLNLGKVAGAGYEDHLHFHIVPRWHGDSNFMAVLADVRTIPEHIKQTYSKLLPLFNKESAHEAG